MEVGRISPEIRVLTRKRSTKVHIKFIKETSLTLEDINRK